MYLLSKIHKNLHSFLGSPVISYCDTPTEKILEFWDNEVKPIMKERLFCIKDSNDFMLKIKDLLLVTADILGLHTHEAELWVLKKVLHQRNDKRISAKDVVKITEFALKITTLSLMAKLNTRYLTQP